MKIEERYQRATQSSNLKHSDRPCQTDILAAVALSDHQFGATLWRLKIGEDAKSLPKALWLVTRLAASQNAKHNWQINVEHVARAALASWVAGPCMICNGLGHPIVEDTPMLAEKDCDACRGTGKAVQTVQPAKQIAEIVSLLEMRLKRHADNAVTKLG